MKSLLVVLIVVLAAVAIIQLYFRYEYVALGSDAVIRVDRITGHACIVFPGYGCGSHSTPAPAST
jgi:hypothetical protein